MRPRAPVRRRQPENTPLRGRRRAFKTFVQLEGAIMASRGGSFHFCLDLRTTTTTSSRDKAGLPREVRMLRLRVKSSLSALTTAAISPRRASRSTMSSTRAALMFSLAAWPFALAGGRKTGKSDTIEDSGTAESGSLLADL